MLKTVWDSETVWSVKRAALLNNLLRQNPQIFRYLPVRDELLKAISALYH